MKYQIDLENYTIKEISPFINEVTIEDLDFNDLNNEINLFKEEIKWDGMWDVDEAKERLKNNWKLVVYKPVDKIKGWGWLSDKNEVKNIYVNKSYRNSKIGKNLYVELTNIGKKLGFKKLESNIDNWNIASVRSIKNAGWSQISPLKIYIHHPYKKSLFYTLCHNSVDRKFEIVNDEGSVFCKYKEIEIEFIFKREITFESDGYHILDYFSAYFDSQSDNNNTKFAKILPDRFYMDRENQQILKKFIEFLKDCPKNQKWIITSFRTEKMLYSDDFTNAEISENFIELEYLYRQLSNHYIVNDNIFIDNNFNLIYPHFFYAFTNSIFQWNRNLNIRWYYEFKQIFDYLNFDYDLMYSVRNHKGFRVQLLNELEKLNIDKLYLQRTDELKENKYFKKFGNDVSKNVKLNSVLGEKDFDDITYIQNIINGLDLFFRVLPKAKMQILCETWSYSKTNFKSQYLSEKTIGLVLSGIPFISTHDYPLLIIQKILNVPPHPFLSESTKCKGDAKLFSEFVNTFMQNFNENYELCKDWSNLVFKKFMYKIENDNSLLDLIYENKFEIFNKKNIF